MLSDIYKEVLESAGYLVDVAADGQECIDKVGESVPSLILLDIFLPKMSGFDIVEKFKQDTELSKIPIIVLTNIYIDKEELVKKGVERCLIKAEVTPGEVVDKVKETLSSAPAN
jgi:CheY-like chemotaxis protein